MADLAWHKTPSFVKNLFPTLQWMGSREGQNIYLTFDDGPIPQLTEEILQILKDFDIQATFFCVGENIKKHPAIFEKVLKDGHSIGNHTYNHLKAWKVGTLEYLANVEKAQNIIEEHGGETHFFRPPYGQLLPSISKELIKSSMEIIMWDILSKDYDTSLNTRKALSKCLKYSEPGSIIVFHDNLKARHNVLDLLPKYINGLMRKGYKFKAL